MSARYSINVHLEAYDSKEDKNIRQTFVIHKQYKSRKRALKAVKKAINKTIKLTTLKSYTIWSSVSKWEVA